MIKCPFCQAQNPDEASVCYNCGRSLLHDATPGDSSPTQPLHTRPAQPISPQGRMGQPPTDATDPYGHLPKQPLPGSQYQPPDATQPFPVQRYGPLYNGQPSYPNQQPYSQPVYPLPAPPALPADNHRDIWPLLIAGLGLLLVIVCGLAFYILTSAAAKEVAGVGAQVSTQVGQVFGGTGSDPAATPVGAASTDTPTPQPEATHTPNPTQAAITDKLLSPECKGSLDQLSQVSDQVKSDPLKVLDDTWRKDLDRAIADMKTHCGSLESASPIPGEIGQVQTLMNQANSEFDQANQLWNQAIDQRDPSKAIGAAQHIGEATKYLGQAISQLQKLTR